MKRFLPIVFAFFALPAMALLPNPAPAAVTYQGELREDGVPLDGIIPMQFDLFASEIGGAPIAGNFLPVEVKNGLFQVELDFGAGAFDGDERWLEISLEDSQGDVQVLEPRQPIGASPMALFSFDTADGGSSSPFEVVSGNVVLSSGRLGLGTSQPGARLHVDADGNEPGLAVTYGQAAALVAHSNAGVSVGTGDTPPAGGLAVKNKTILAGELETFNDASFNAPVIVNSSASNPFTVTADPGTSAATKIYVNNHGLTVGAGALGAPNRGLRVHSDARIGGRVGINQIGNQTPARNLHVRADSTTDIALILEAGSTSTAAQPRWGIGTSRSSDDMRLFFNTGTGGYFARGSFNSSTGAYSTSSDERLKDDIKPLGAVLDRILELDASSYRFKNAGEHGSRTIGFMAQDVQKLFPEIVEQGDEGYLAMHYARLGVIAVQAIGEQQAIIAAQKEEIDALRAELEAQRQATEQRLAQLESILLGEAELAEVSQ